MAAAPPKQNDEVIDIDELYIVDLDRVTIFIWGSVIVFMISLGIKMYLS
jgi:hypothetical protein